MYLERRTVSRKTPGDGRLEITKQAALRIQQLGRPFAIEIAGQSAGCTIHTFECTCRGPDNRHVHYFLESEPLKVLKPDSKIDLELDEAANRVVLRQAAPEN